MLVSDVEEPVVAAAARTPFESARRVFVIERVETMNDEAANRLLKTLEEPPSFVHMLLLTDRRAGVAPTIASRCQHVRFDPLAPALIAERLTGVEGERALACARLSLGDTARAELLASERGGAMRAAAEAFVRGALAADTEQRQWLEMLVHAKAAGEAVGEAAKDRLESELELLPSKERKRFERETADSRRRGERRARLAALDTMLSLGELWLRDVLCVCEGASELIHAVDRREALDEDAREHRVEAVREAIELVHDARLALELNVSEELALEGLAYRIHALSAGD
jgi:DNA polymerase-3 subunit delta'